MKAKLEKAASLIAELEETLESYEPPDDARGWMVREAFTLLARTRGIVEALVSSEKGQGG